jgi:hypothetical protein
MQCKKLESVLGSKTRLFNLPYIHLYVHTCMGHFNVMILGQFLIWFFNMKLNFGVIKSRIRLLK